MGEGGLCPGAVSFRSLWITEEQMTSGQTSMPAAVQEGAGRPHVPDATVRRRPEIAVHSHWLGKPPPQWPWRTPSISAMQEGS